MTAQEKGRLKFYVEAPKFRGFSTALKNACFDLGLDLEMERDKGLWFETLRVKISGDIDKLERIQRWVKSIDKD